MRNLYAIKGFANYFNRRVRREEELSSYLGGRVFWLSANANFAENDGVTATCVFLISESERDEIRVSGMPDYLVVTDGLDNVVSRWYVVEALYLRELQYELHLRRDLVSEFLDEVLSAPTLVERGPLPASSPFLFVPDQGSFNQIKAGETLLKDESESPWIVGYVSSDTAAPSPITANATRSSSYPELSDLPMTLNDPSDPGDGGYLEAPVSAVEYAVLCGGFYLSSLGSTFGYYEQGFLDNADPCIYKKPYTEFSTAANRWNREVGYQRSSLDSEFASRHSVGTPAQYAELLSANGKIFYDTGTQKHYMVNVFVGSRREILDACDDPNYPALRSRLVNVARNTVAYVPPIALFEPEVNPDGGVRAYAKVGTLTVSMAEVSVPGQIRTSISNDRNKLTDAPFDMFCMRLNPRNLALAQRLVSAPLGAGETKKFYDVQILPFCPRREILDDGYDPTDASELGYGSQAIEEYVDGDWETVDYIYWCLTSSDSFSIAADVAITQRAPENPAANVKLSDQLDLYRLSSPNYSSSFDFSVARNGGVRAFRIDFTYRPISPYIHVAPVFSGLYGTFNDDARGLILSGDYSIDMISDPWTEYQTLNKNYEAIFDTRVKAMESMRNLERFSAAFNGVMGTGAAIGAGAKMGGVAGAAIAGSVAATKAITSAVVGEEKYQIERKAFIETFRYELGNVKAQPDALTKVTAYNVNNKYFPVLELYSATDEEASALLRFWDAYNFPIGAMTTLKSILTDGRTKEWEFVKGRIAYLEGVSEDSHVVNEIYAEIDRGVYVYGRNE